MSKGKSSQFKHLEVKNLGVEYSDYFRGFGLGVNGCTDAVTGIGSDPREALDDAIEMIAQGTDLNDASLAEIEDIASAGLNCDWGKPLDDDQHWYCGIRYSLL
jgi:hypothetical protein